MFGATVAAGVVYGLSEHDLAGADRAGIAGALLGTGILAGKDPAQLTARLPLGEWSWLPELRW